LKLFEIATIRGPVFFWLDHTVCENPLYSTESTISELHVITSAFD